MRVQVETGVADVQVDEASERKSIVYIKPNFDAIVKIGEEEEEIRLKAGSELKIIVKARL